jgi:acetyl-CoA synthetase
VFTYNYARFNAKAVLAMLARRPITTLCAPPTVWRMLVQEQLGDYRVSLREVVSAGEPLNPEVIERVQAAWGIAIRDGFGQTETTAVVGNSPGQVVKPGSMGRPLPGYEVELLDHEGRPAPDGEICLRLSPPPLGLMLGYGGAGMEPAGTPAQEGYHHTGDLASRDEDGYITYIGRLDDVFKSSDYRISPFELENVLVRHPAVAEAAVVASPDPLRHAVPKAFVLLAPGYAAGADLARIFLFVRQNVAPYKRIRRLEFSDLPKTISGKIRRVQLRTSGSQQGAQEFREENFGDR